VFFFTNGTINMSYDYWIIKVDSKFKTLSEIKDEGEFSSVGDIEYIKKTANTVVPELNWKSRVDSEGRVAWWAESRNIGPQLSLLVQNKNDSITSISVLTSARLDYMDLVEKLANALNASYVDMQTMQIVHKFYK